ncbi:MAG: hypothetical protein BZ138_03325 [Methanosphaera sp. rholeuAM270]|nr:MAG: hypothetical protein BZ138_03325 [Methanosphaera sp. rholeuAM270]
MNNKGQIIITELLLYIIVMTIILSLIIFTMVTLDDNQVTRINTKDLNALLDNSLDMLTKTSGTPSNWDKLGFNDIKSIGLKSDNNHFISYDKLIKLKNNNELLDNYFPDDVSYELTLYPKSNRNNLVKIAGNGISNKRQIQSKSRVVLLDYGFNITSFQNDEDNSFCPYNHDRNWTCKAFTVSTNSLNKGKYYIVTNSYTEYILSNTYSENISSSTNTILNINDKMNQLLENENETIYLHINTNKNNTYLAYDKNNKEEYLKEVIKPEIYILNMKIAI